MLLTSIAVSTVFSIFILPGILLFIKDNGKIIKNYNGHPVYNCGGIFLFINVTLICAFLMLLGGALNGGSISINALMVLVGVLSSSLTGYIDDTSNSYIRGILGHGRMLLKGKFTSGNIKALTGVIVSLVICIAERYGSYNFIINLFLIPLTQNFINLMDLRPGRAVKIYIFMFLISIPFIDAGSIYFSINAGTIISLAFYIKHELDEAFMLGDTGANVLGIMLGMTAASSKNIYFKTLLLFFIGAAQIYGEKHSINDFIENNRILKKIDLWGRKKHEHD